MNAVLETKEFSDFCLKLGSSELDWIEKMKDQLRENLLVGRPLHSTWLREKRLQNKRLYYVINKETKKALLLFFEPKKRQQEIIDHVIAGREHYLRIVNH